MIRNECYPLPVFVLRDFISCTKCQIKRNPIVFWIEVCISLSRKCVFPELHDPDRSRLFARNISTRDTRTILALGKESSLVRERTCRMCLCEIFTVILPKRKSIRRAPRIGILNRDVRPSRVYKI